MFVVSRCAFVISQRAIYGNPPDRLIRAIAINFPSSIAGTSFRGANLTDADFSYASLANTTFIGADLTRTRFYLAQKLHLAITTKTILANRTVLNLLDFLAAEPGISYKGLNLKGVNLNQATLSDLDLTATNLSGATLENADLQRANLSQVRALGTNFRNANLTHACLDDWDTDDRTQLPESTIGYVRIGKSQ